MLLRAIHLTSQYPPAGQGGLGTHVLGLTRALAREMEVEVVSPVQSPGDPLEPDTALEWGLSVAPMPGSILHAHNYEVALPALVAKALTGAPLVVTLHLPAPEPYRDLERKLLESADAVIAVSHSLAAEYRDRGWTLPEPVVIPNGVDPFYHPAPEPRREGDRLLLAGRLDPQKGVDVALLALRQLLPTFPGLRLHMAGAGPWEQAYRNLARRLGLAGRVWWLGWLEPVALREEYRRCTAFVMPSRFEPFGLSALEAMVCGAPVIASATGGLPEFITDHETGLIVPPADPAALAAALRELLLNPQQAQRLVTAATGCAGALTWDHAAGATLQLYRRLSPSASRPVTSLQQRHERAATVIQAARSQEATDAR